jgi:hypothetical protein
MVDGYVGKAADSFEPKDADDPSNTAMNAGRARTPRPNHGASGPRSGATVFRDVLLWPASG